MGVRRPVRLVLTERASVPILAGWRRPAILLPAALAGSRPRPSSRFFPTSSPTTRAATSRGSSRRPSRRSSPGRSPSSVGRDGSWRAPRRSSATAWRRRMPRGERPMRAPSSRCSWPIEARDPSRSARPPWPRRASPGGSRSSRGGAGPRACSPARKLALILGARCRCPWLRGVSAAGGAPASARSSGARPIEGGGIRAHPAALTSSGAHRAQAIGCARRPTTGGRPPPAGARPSWRDRRRADPSRRHDRCPRPWPCRIALRLLGHQKKQATSVSIRYAVDARNGLLLRG
jgi:hypothetical protein